MSDDKNIIPVELGDEMQSSYLNYSMSVITDRALPDVRDGLKPVHRRILYSMYDGGLTPSTQHRKCARIVGDTMGRYHPHGDQAIYDTMVGMAQSFSYRYPLVDGHGNFGSIDGDSAAAMRYTEARMNRVSVTILDDIRKETVDFQDNYDGTTQEPAVLPSMFPNFLVNGSSGIAVGMATNAPPHNLTEVVKAIVTVIDEPDVTLGKLMTKIKGPDFPTGGVIMGREGIKQAYSTGRGIITVRGKAHVEQSAKGHSSIVVTEIPYQVNKANLIDKIASLVKDKKVSDIRNMRDESDISGIRLVIELKQGAIPQVVLNQLYKHTQLQGSFGIINLALVKGIPKTLTLKETIELFIKHRQEVVTKRTKFDLRKAEERAHILEGFLIALKNLDKIIKTIKESPDTDTARKRLMKGFGLSEIQAQAILDMRLQKLTGIEQKKVKEELDDLKIKIKEYKAILADPKKILQIIKDELNEIKSKYGDDRRTEIIDEEGEFDVEDLIAEEDMVVTVSHGGYVKRVPIHAFRQQKRGGKGVTGVDLKDDDFVEHMFVGSTHHYVMFFSNSGKVFKLKVFELPEGTRTTKGKHMANFLPLSNEEKIVDLVTVRDFGNGNFLVFSTKNGMVKKTALKEYDSARKDGLIAINLNDGDELMKAHLTSGKSEIMLVSQKGQSIKFPESQVRPMGRATAGVKSFSLDDEDRVLTMVIPSDGTHLFVVTANGFGKRTEFDKYPIQRRGGKGVKTIKLTDTKGELVGAMAVTDEQELIVISKDGIVIRTQAKQIPVTGRATQGARVMRVGDKDCVSAVGIVVKEDKKEETNLEVKPAEGEKPIEEEIEELLDNEEQLELDVAVEEPKKEVKKPAKKEPVAKKEPKPGKMTKEDLVECFESVGKWSKVGEVLGIKPGTLWGMRKRWDLL